MLSSDTTPGRPGHGRTALSEDGRSRALSQGRAWGCAESISFERADAVVGLSFVGCGGLGCDKSFKNLCGTQRGCPTTISLGEAESGNREERCVKVIFTPHDEPYLGRETVRAFDELIVVCLEVNSRIAPGTHKIEKDDLQWAACQIIPSGISLALSIRELVRQGYLYGALVLLRPLVERSVTILYLQRFPEKVGLWTSGWEHKKRPTLAQMFNEIGGDRFPGCGPEITRSLNSLTHGDPSSAMWNLVSTGQDTMGHAVSKILARPDLCDKICMEAAAWMAVLLATMNAVFPELRRAEI